MSLNLIMLAGERKRSFDKTKIELLLPFDGNLKDYSKNNAVVTNYGVSLLTNSGKFGYSARHSQRTWVSLNNSPAFDFKSKDFTIECFLRVNSTASNGAAIFGRWGIGPNTNTDIYFGIYLNKIHVSIGTGYGILVSPAAVNDGITRHVALERVGTNLLLGINGKIVASTQLTVDVPYSASQVLRTGVWDDPSSYLDGNISDLRVVIGDYVYGGEYVPPTAPFHK